MSITKSYNKHTDTYYAYDTIYVWDEKAQKKIQKRVCIGKYAPETGEIVPTAGRGRPSRQKTVTTAQERDGQNISASISREISAAVAELNELEASINALEERVCLLKERMLSLRRSVSENES